MGGIEVIWQGRRVTVPELSRETGISDYMFYKWLRKGYTPEEVVEHARSPRGEKHEYRGQWLTIRQLAYIAGMTPSTISYRMHTGWSVEDAVNTPVGARPGGGPPPKREKPPAADTPEGQRWNAAHEICKTIAASPPGIQLPLHAADDRIRVRERSAGVHHTLSDAHSSAAHGILEKWRNAVRSVSDF